MVEKVHVMKTNSATKIILCHFTGDNGQGTIDRGQLTTQKILWQWKLICTSPILIHNLARRQGQRLKRFMQWRQIVQPKSSHATSRGAMDMIKIQAKANRASAKSYECNPWFHKVMGTMGQKVHVTATNRATIIISLIGGTNSCHKISYNMRTAWHDNNEDKCP